MSNWIDDACEQAKRDKEIKEAQQKLELERGQQKRENLIKRFREAIFQTRSELENFFTAARENRLLVSNSEEKTFQDKGCGNFLYQCYGWGDENGATGNEWRYCVNWKITEPFTEKNLNIYLGVYIFSNIVVKRIKTGIFTSRIEKIEIESWKPTIQMSYIVNSKDIIVNCMASEVEAQIKSWIVQIFSEQK